MNNEKIKKAYYDPKSGFVGIDKLFKRLKELGIKREEIVSALQDQELYQLTRQPKQRHQNIIIENPGEQWAGDLVDMTNYKRWNKGYGWILNVIDMYSRYVFSEPLINKGNKTVEEGMRKILERAKKEKIKLPWRILTDNGKEFTSKEWTKLLNETDITPVYTKPFSPQTNGAVERFNQTLKRMLYKYFTAGDTFTWYDVLNEFVENYNSAPHRALPQGITPKTALDPVNREKMFQHIYDYKYNPAITNQKNMPIGEKVRIIKDRLTFQKSYGENYDQKEYIIIAMNHGITGIQYDDYKLKRVDNGEILKGRFLISDLIPIKKNEKPQLERAVKKINRQEKQKMITIARKMQRNEDILEQGRKEDYITAVNTIMNNPLNKPVSKMTRARTQPIASRTRSKK